MASDPPTGAQPRLETANPPPLRPGRRSLAARAYIWLGARSVSLVLGSIGAIIVLGLALSLRLFDAWSEQKRRVENLEAELHHRWADEVARQLDLLNDQTQRLQEVNLAAARAGLLLGEGRDGESIGRFFWAQLESVPETGYLGLLRLDGTPSGIGVRRRADGRLRVESVAFQRPMEGHAGRSDPLAGCRRQFFRLDPTGRPIGRIIEHDFNSPWDADLEAALLQARDQDWRALFDWALGDPVPGLEVKPILDPGGRTEALLATAPAFGQLALSDRSPSNLDIWLLDSDGKVLARSETAPPPSAHLREQLANLETPDPARIATVPTEATSTLHLTPWSDGSEGSAALWIATRAKQQHPEASGTRPGIDASVSHQTDG